MSMQEQSKLKEFCSQLLVLFPLLTTILLFIVTEITDKNIFKIYSTANTNTYVWYKIKCKTYSILGNVLWYCWQIRLQGASFVLDFCLPGDQTALVSHAILTQHTWLNSRSQQVCWSLELDTKHALLRYVVSWLPHGVRTLGAALQCWNALVY